MIVLSAPEWATKVEPKLTIWSNLPSDENGR